MIKKMEFFGLFFSTTALFTLNESFVSCSKQVVAEPDLSINSFENDKKIQSVSEEIKDFVKHTIYSQNDDYILVINELLDGSNFNAQEKLVVINEIIGDLDRLDVKLNNNISESKVELENKNVIQGLKSIVLKNCSTLEKEFKKIDGKFSADFQEVNGNIVEIDEDNLIFNLKKFSITKILNEVNENTDLDSIEERKDIIAKSRELEIYNFTTDLKINLNVGNNKKVLIPVNDLNFFVVKDKGQIQILKEGLTSYLQKTVEQNITPIYLDGPWTGKSNRTTAEYFSKILKEKNYDLSSDDNRREITNYLAKKYLPSLIYKNNSHTEESLKILSKELIIQPEDSNFRTKQGMDMTDEFQKKVNFLNFFGNNAKKRQIERETIGKISIQDFLQDKTLYEEKYHSLGSGYLKINDWNIRGFPLKPISIRFKIYLNYQILKKEITDLQICLNALLDVMSKSSVKKRNEEFLLTKFLDKYGRTLVKYVENDADNKNYTVDITSPKSKEHYYKIRSKYGEKASFEDILNALYTDQAIEKAKSDNESIKDTLFKFKTNLNNDENVVFKSHEYTDHYYVRQQEYYSIAKNSNVANNNLNVYIVFNSSFKIKLNDELLVAQKLLNEINTTKLNQYWLFISKGWTNINKLYFTGFSFNDINRVIFENN